MNIYNKELSPIVVDAEMLPAIEELVKSMRFYMSIAGHGANSMFPTLGLWPGRKYWCMIACGTSSAACILGTSGAAMLACLAAQVACEHLVYDNKNYSMNYRACPAKS